jgi:hypothetical protein
LQQSVVRRILLLARWFDLARISASFRQKQCL